MRSGPSLISFALPLLEVEKLCSKLMIFKISKFASSSIEKRFITKFPILEGVWNLKFEGSIHKTIFCCNFGIFSFSVAILSYTMDDSIGRFRNNSSFLRLTHLKKLTLIHIKKPGTSLCISRWELSKSWILNPNIQNRKSRKINTLLRWRSFFWVTNTRKIHFRLKSLVNRLMELWGLSQR